MAQIENFEKALVSMSGELDPTFNGITFDQMLNLLPQVIRSCGIPGRSNRLRFFSRHYLKMAGDKYLQVRGWLSGSVEMSEEEIVLVLRILQQYRNGTLSRVNLVIEQQTEQSGKSSPTASGLVRKVIDHTIGSFQSLVDLITEAGVKPDTAFDSDRIQIQGALREIAKRFGIIVKFEIHTTDNQPLTSGDLTEIGMSEKRRRG